MCPSSRTYTASDLQLAGGQGGQEHDFISGTKWPVIVAAKSKLIVTKINPAKLLYAIHGHIAPTTMKAMIRSGMQTGTDTTLHDIIVQLPTGLYCA